MSKTAYYNRRSDLNISSTPLNSAETFTGRWEDVSRFGQVTFSAKSDVSGTLYADFSSDASTAHSTLTYDIAAGINEVHRLTVTRSFFRLRYVNNGTNQSTFSLDCIFGDTAQLSAPMNLTLGLDADAIAIRGDIPADDIVRGLRQGVQHFTKFGHRETLTAANGEETIWDSPGNFTPLSSAETFTITYNSTTDGSDAGATGAKTLYFQYIDSNGLSAEAVHTLSNTGSDVTSFSGLGINRLSVSSTGSSDYNVNDITVTATTAGTNQAFIEAEHSVTQHLVYFTDSNSYAVGKFLWLSCNKISGGGSPRVLVKAYVWNRNIATRFEIFRVTIDTSVTNIVQINEPVGFRLSPTDVVYFVADTDTNNTTITGRFSLVEYKID